MENTTRTSDAFALMGGLALSRPGLPEVVPYSGGELAAAASDGNFLYFVSRGSVMRKFGSRPIAVSAHVPRQYEHRRELDVSGKAEWVLAKFATEPSDMTLSARHLAELCLEWNRDPSLRQYYGKTIGTSTYFEEDPSLPVGIRFERGRVLLLRKQLSLRLIGLARPAIAVE